MHESKNVSQRQLVCSFATVYSSFTRSHSLVRSITVFDSPNPDSLVSIHPVILNFHRKVVIDLNLVVANKRIRLFDVWCVQLVSRGPFHKEKQPLQSKTSGQPEEFRHGIERTRR